MNRPNQVDVRNSLSVENEKIFIDSSEGRKPCLKFTFKKNSNFRRVLDFVNLLNLLYVAISIPLLIAFDIQMGVTLILVEILSLAISLGIIVINLRTPVIMRGGTTLNFKTIIAYYYHNGLMIDIIALWPLNLILGAADVIYPLWLIPPLRLVRVITVWKCMHIFGKFELFFKKYNILMHIIKAALFLCILWHWASCLWFFTNFYIESEEKYTWMEYNGLDTADLYKRVMYSYYTIMNVVSSVGYGDMFPMTDIERLFIVFLINSGDALFAVAFGLIAGITMQASKNKDTDAFFKKMHSIKDLLKQNGGDETQKAKVEQYFAYSWHLHKSTNMVSIKSLSTQLPYRLSKEVVYYSTRNLLEPMFKSFGSENLIKDVSTVLEQTIYLPGDFIILKDDIGEEMYFIAEGTVYILAADKRTVLNTLNQGSYFGEMAIFLDSNKRTAYVQAETFCSILILKKSDLDNIKINYPSVAKDIRKEAQKRAIETKEIEEANKEEMWQEVGNPEEEIKNLERYYSTPTTLKPKHFPNRMFSNASRRSSHELPGTPGSTSDIAETFRNVKRAKRMSLFGNLTQNHSKDNTTSIKVSEGEDNISGIYRELLHYNNEPDAHNLIENQMLKPEELQEVKRPQKPSEEHKSKPSQQNIIHEDIENEDKASATSSITDEEEQKVPKKEIKSAALVDVSPEKRRLGTDPDGSGNQFHKVTRVMSESTTNKNMNTLGVKPSLKRSTTTKFVRKQPEEASSPKIKSQIAKLLQSVNLERRLQSHGNEKLGAGTFDDSEEKGIIDYRRKGYLKQRRLSRINLGKQLALSETSGLKLQWIVDYKDFGSENNM